MATTARAARLVRAAYLHCNAACARTAHAACVGGIWRAYAAGAALYAWRQNRCTRTASRRAAAAACASPAAAVRRAYIAPWRVATRAITPATRCAWFTACCSCRRAPAYTHARITRAAFRILARALRRRGTRTRGMFRATRSSAALTSRGWFNGFATRCGRRAAFCIWPMLPGHHIRAFAHMTFLHALRNICA